MRLAGTAAVTLALGLGAGMLVAPRWGASHVVVLEIEHGAAAVVRCADQTVESSRGEVALVPTQQPCDVELRATDGTVLRGRVDAWLPGRYQCHAKQGKLTCTER